MQCFHPDLRVLYEPIKHNIIDKSPLATASYILRLIALRPILDELAWTEQLPQLAHLIRREDIPRRPQRLPRPTLR